MDKDYLLFDLDGTVTDPKEGIVNSVVYSLEALGAAVPDREGLTVFIGPPLRESYKKYFCFADETAERAVEKYREYYSERGMYENYLYEGMEALLKRQREMGRTLVLATSKATVYARRILEHFGIDGHFSFVAGCELDGRRSKKGEVIAYALAEVGIAPGRALMIGDREHDIIGARLAGVESIGVLYGYGSREELTSAGAARLVGSVAELGRILGAPRAVES